MRILNPNLALSQASVDEVINVSQNSEQLVPDSPEEEGDKIYIPTDSQIARQREEEDGMEVESGMTKEQEKFNEVQTKELKQRGQVLGQDPEGWHAYSATCRKDGFTQES